MTLTSLISARFYLRPGFSTLVVGQASGHFDPQYRVCVNAKDQPSLDVYDGLCGPTLKER